MSARKQDRLARSFRAPARDELPGGPCDSLPVPFPLLEAYYGVARDSITKVNIKGRLQVWHDGTADEVSYLEVPLAECRRFTRPGCTHCPDFAAEHADVSLGGIGKNAGMTLTITRSELSEEILTGMQREGWVTVAEAAPEDPKAVELIQRLAARQRRRWPVEETKPHRAPAMVPDDS